MGQGEVHPLRPRCAKKQMVVIYIIVTLCVASMEAVSCAPHVVAYTDSMKIVEEVFKAVKEKDSLSIYRVTCIKEGGCKTVLMGDNYRLKMSGE